MKYTIDESNKTVTIHQSSITFKDMQRIQDILTELCPRFLDSVDDWKIETEHFFKGGDLPSVPTNPWTPPFGPIQPYENPWTAPYPNSPIITYDTNTTNISSNTTAEA